MTEKDAILVTGVANYWGLQVARRLIDKTDAHGEAAHHVIGLDVNPVHEAIQGLDFIQADVRNPLMTELLRTERVRTVCHLVFVERDHHSEDSFDLNVMGTMKLLGACAEAGVRKVVLKSSTAVYGARPENPAFITENHPLQGSRAYGYNRHLVEIEAFCNGFRRQVPEMVMTILRFASVLGPNVDTPMTRFLKQPLSPVLLGFDPLMQVIHEQDVVAALAQVVEDDNPGVFNVAAEGVLPLSRLMALAAKIPLPIFHVWAYWGVDLLNSAGLSTGKYAPIELDYLRYPWIADLKKMHAELGFVPQYTAEEALREFAVEHRMRRYTPEKSSLAYDEKRLRDTLERRRWAREAEAEQNPECPEERNDE
jgi:UDP-glucose 4-epimerase